jgi:hypothetical protein
MKEYPMKKTILIFSMLIMVAVVFAGKFFDDRIKSLLQTINLSEDNAKNSIFSDISSSGFYFPGLNQLKSIAAGDRSATVEAIAKYVKDFTATDDFKNRYNEFRESRKPSPPEKPKTMAELKKETKESYQKSIEEMKTTKASAPSDQKAMYDETIKMLEEQLKSLDDPNNTMYSPEMDVYMQQAYEQQLEQHKMDIEKWEADYPVNNPKLLIKSWLESFLEQTNDVDFKAQTAIDKGRTLFVKQEYERKNNLWKLCYRGGKETTDAARKFAQAWLGELK